MKKRIEMFMAAVALLAGVLHAEDINVGPLLTTKWNQISPYIDFGPIKPDKEEGYTYENHMVNGCVAVAYSQVLKYWQWPEKLEEDVTYTHFANSTYGFTQTLLAGTEFNWDKQRDDYVTGGRASTQAEILYLGLGQVFAAMMTEMKFNLTMSGVNLERAVDNPYFNLGEFISDSGQRTLAMCEDEARDSIVGGMPLIMGIDVNSGGKKMAHAIVGDGWQKTGDTTSYIHCNYGWGGDNNDKFYAFSSDTSRFIANHKPRPMVVIDPVPYHVQLPVKVTWHFPKKGYENEITGFDVKAYEVTDVMEDWTEDFENAKGQSWGEGVAVGELADCGNTGKMLQFTTDSSRDHYAWPTLFLGTGSELSFRVRSDHIRSHQTAWVEAYEANRGWKKIYDIQLYETPLAENDGWTNVTVKLDARYTNKAVGFRFRTARAASGDNWQQMGAFGIQIDDVKVTNVHRMETTPTQTESVGGTSRAALFDTGLDVGKRYVFFVEPNVTDGVRSNGTGAEIVAEQPEKLQIYGVQSVCANAPAFDAENIYREAYLGTNQFAVFGTANMTKLRATLSQTSLIDFFWDKDAASSDPDAKIGSSRPVSVADAVKVEACPTAGRFLVTIDFSNCTKALRFTREIIVLEGEDDLGNIVRKNIMLLFNRIGNEQAITPAQVPAYTGPMPSEESEDDPGDEGDEEEGTEEGSGDVAGGNPVDDGYTRFCHGVSKTAGAYDVTRSSTYNTITPISYNLIFWWVDRYVEVNGETPSDYVAPSTASIPNNGSWTIQSYTANLLDSALKTTLAAGTKRDLYFPAASYAANDWNGGTTGDSAAKAAGRRIYAALANGPIGVKVIYSLSLSYGAVIWGCDYATDGDDKYATKVYITETTSNNRSDQVVVRELKWTETNDGNFTNVGIKDFKGSGNPGVIDYYYPILGPAGKQASGDDDDPGEPDDPASDEPVIAAQKAGGDAVDTGKIDTYYGFRLIYNYWQARKTAIQEKKQLFILSGASWCSYCTKTKEYLQSLGAAFTDAFVVYYADKDGLTTSPYFEGGLPQYGSADPRTVNAFAGIYGEGTSGTPDWTKAWYATDSKLYYGNRGGFSQDEVNRTISEASGKAFGELTGLEIRGPSSVMSDKANTYELYAVFADGTEMRVDHGVTWSLMSGAGTLSVSTSDGDASAELTVTSEQAVLRAESTYYFTGSVDLTITSTDESKIKALTIVTDVLNLEDNRSPVLKATATLDDDSEVAISGIGTWHINSHAKVPRSDAELESSQAPNVTVDAFGKLTYDQGYQFEVYDHTLNVTLTANGRSVTKDITVWGPTKVAPVSWELASKTKRLTKYGVVRLKCARLKYNYGGAIKTTSDTYYGNFRTVMQFAGGSSEYSYLRGLSFVSPQSDAGTWTLGLQAQRVNGQCQYWTPENFATYHSEQIVNVAEGDVVTDADHGLVTEGFFKAYWESRCADMTNDQLKEFALEDSDGDGFANWQEYILGTDPTDAADALYLTQGYQHLTAPASDVSAFQYKIMFAQRPGRYYYLYGKENWNDAWTRVAKINFSGMAADQSLQITILNQTMADNGKFFRVGAVLADHAFYARSNAEVVPNILVAAPNAIIDLTASNAMSTAILDLTSFDTDATDAGTIRVKVAANIAAGTQLIAAPKSAKASLEACAPYESGDVAFEVVTDPSDAERVVLRVKGLAPAIEGGAETGTLEVTDEKIVVTPCENVTDIAIVNPGDRKVVIPPSIGKIDGVTESGNIVVSQSFGDGKTVNLTPLMTFTKVGTGLSIALDAAKQDETVDVGGEPIRLQPEFANGETPFSLQDGSIVFTVKSIPGLKYQVLSSTTLDANGFAPSGEARTATSARSELTIPHTGETSQGFYKIQVSR